MPVLFYVTASEMFSCMDKYENPVLTETGSHTIAGWIRDGKCPCVIGAPTPNHLTASLQLIHIAAAYSHMWLLRHLLANGCDINAKTTGQHQTPLSLVAASNAKPPVELVNFLLEAGKKRKKKKNVKESVQKAMRT